MCVASLVGARAVEGRPPTAGYDSGTPKQTEAALRIPD